MKKYIHIHRKVALTGIVAALGIAPITARADDPGTGYSLQEVVITAKQPDPDETALFSPARVTSRDIETIRTQTSDAVRLLENIPGVAVMSGGGVSGLPAIRGLSDDRVGVRVNGVTTNSACANHMNPPLSYIDAGHVAKASVMAGITPVSMGGDSIGGAIVVSSPAPRFAEPDETIHRDARLSSYFRSNETGYGGSVTTSVATRNVSLGYSGAWNRAGNYRDGHGGTITSTYYSSDNQTLTLNLKGKNDLLTLEAGLQNIPRQGFANQQMDMTGNRSTLLNLDYRRETALGAIDARLYWRMVRHEMNIGRDKSTFPMPMDMPMKTRGSDLGYVLKTEIPLADAHTLRLGSEYNRFTLNDWWPPVSGGGPLMSPDTFKSINDGHRDRLGFYTELESEWKGGWSTLLGLRADSVWSSTGEVQGYSSRYATDAAAFNGRKRDRTDVNVDLTLLVRYEPDASARYEIGYARKNRSPNLYERYAWSTNMMASGMINWFGDGNYYVGNPDLKPEVAHQISAGAHWRDRGGSRWEIGLNAHFTYIQDFIDVDLLRSVNYGSNDFSQLRFANHDAIIYGLDLNWAATLWNESRFGQGQLRGTLGWVRGSRLDTGDSLYRMMPLNARISLEETLFKTWRSALELQLVDSKRDVDPLRHEQRTPGYALLNLRSSYQWRNITLDAGISNLLDKHYYLPLGGVNFDNFMAGGWNTKLLPLAGQGRSFHAGLTVQF